MKISVPLLSAFVRMQSFKRCRRFGVMSSDSSRLVVPRRLLLAVPSLLSLFACSLAHAVTFTTLVSFDGTNGSNPFGALVQGGNGSFYGTTSSGGTDGHGTVFMITPDGGMTNLVNFNGANGSQPQAPLVLTADGSLYGTTAMGGDFDEGTVFVLTPAGRLTTLLSFDGTNGAQPLAEAVLARDGNLYGTTATGGAAGHGTVFKLSTTGALMAVVSFNGANGINPCSGLLQATDGNLYGTAAAGGDLYNSGTVFRMTTNNVLTVLYSFNSPTGGVGPHGGLTQGRDSNLYGTTVAGGTNGLAKAGDGTVFRITRTGTLTTLYSFGGTNGVNPFCRLLQGTDDNLYGTTRSGGGYDRGTVFSLTTNGLITPLHSFKGGNDGSAPYAGVIRGTDGNLYGTASAGGKYGHGTVFKISGFVPFITVQPVAQTIQIGDTVTFVVAADGSTPLSYQWKLNSVNLLDGGNVSGAASSSLTISNATARNAGTYSVVVKNGAGSTASSNAALIVVDPVGKDLPTITLTSPSQRAFLETLDITLTGRTGGTTTVARVYYRLNGSNWELANAVAGLAKWTAELVLIPGTNTVEAYAVNIAGTSSLTNTWVFTCIPNPFLPLVGDYSGLFFSPALIAPDSSGAFTLKLTKKGKLTGTFWVGGKRYSGSGQLDTNGNAHVTIPRGDLSAVSVQLAIEIANSTGVISGTASDGMWTAALTGSKFAGGTIAGAFTGQYTLLIPGDDTSEIGPGGDSYGTVTVDKVGKFRLAGALADGTKVTQSGFITSELLCPVYIPLYNGRGALLSQLEFANSPAQPISGEVVWIKPADVTAQLYSQGFTNAVDLQTSAYVRPGKGERVLNLSEADVILMGDSLVSSITNHIVLSVNDRVSNLSSNRLGLSFTKASGLFSGSVEDSRTGQLLKFKGVVLQNTNLGCGFFLGKGDSGKVRIQGR